MVEDIREEDLEDPIQKGKKSPVNLKRFAFYLNPVCCFFTAYFYVRRNIFSYNWDKAIEMSGVVDTLPPEIRRKLTVCINSHLILPQQSFIYYFNGFNLSKVDIDAFKSRFVERWCSRGDEFLKTFEEAEEKNEDTILNFWRNFEPILQAPPSLNSIHSMRSQIFWVSFFQKLRRFKRTIFSGSGMY
ncbi:hypothetical protein [Candidatus Mycoplasma haematohominis]|uniref:hypothetical protein n=1 Tax=Candidatus Mycoplasma haematohominis TaxID=1494318 RepID=UPI001C0A7756|nr:hypothetical protein [Candidatus Mycoplasma haemohominis]